MKIKPTSIAIPEAKPAQLAPAPKGYSRPGGRVRVKAPRTVQVTLADVIAAVQDCTDDDELVVAVLSRLLRACQARSLPNFDVIDRYAAA